MSTYTVAMLSKLGRVGSIKVEGSARFSVPTNPDRTSQTPTSPEQPRPRVLMSRSSREPPSTEENTFIKTQTGVFVFSSYYSLLPVYARVSQARDKHRLRAPGNVSCVLFPLRLSSDQLLLIYRLKYVMRRRDVR